MKCCDQRRGQTQPKFTLITNVHTNPSPRAAALFCCPPIVTKHQGMAKMTTSPLMTCRQQAAAETEVDNGHQDMMK